MTPSDPPPGRAGGTSELTLVPASDAQRGEIAELFVASRRAAVPAMPPVLDEADARRWVAGWDLSTREVWVALEAARVVGYASLDDDWLDGLYVAPDRARSGVGSALLQLVKARRPDGFALWVFASNTPARSFYARHGLVDLEHTDGSDNMEHAPDLRMAWPGPDPVGYFRARIDEVDAELATLLARRAAITAAVQEHKPVGGQAGRDADREAEIATRMARVAPALGEDRVARIMHTVISESLAAAEERPAQDHSPRHVRPARPPGGDR